MKTMFVNTYWWWHPLQLRQVVREQCSYVYMYNIDIKRALSHQATGLFYLNDVYS